MSTLINLSLDVTKVTKKNLGKGKYLNLTISVNDETNKYGQNVAAWEEQSKEDREAKTEKNYVGNGKVIWTEGLVSVAEKSESKESKPVKKAAPKKDAVDDLPW